MATKQIRYDQLTTGMVVYVQGYRFRVRGDVRRYPPSKPSDRGAWTIRFTGEALDPSLVRTGYDGGVYGGYDWLIVTVEA